MSESQSLFKPFIPAWMDDLGLSPAEFRLYAHLCRSADNSTGLAWPSYKRMTAITGNGKTTLRRSINELEKRKLIQKVSKPFGGSCRYKVFPIILTREEIESSNNTITDTIDEPPIVPPQGQEGNLNKAIQGRESIVEFSPEVKKLVLFFKDTLGEITPPKKWKENFSKAINDLITKDKKNIEEIEEVIKWGRSDSFWKSNFYSPAKLRKKNKDGISYYDVFKDKMKASSNASYSNNKTLNLGNRTGTIEEL